MTNTPETTMKTRLHQILETTENPAITIVYHNNTEQAANNINGTLRAIHKDCLELATHNDTRIQLATYTGIKTIRFYITDVPAPQPTLQGAGAALQMFTDTPSQ